MGDPQNHEASLLSSSSSPSCISESEDVPHSERMPPFWRNLETKKRSLSKQLSPYEVPRNIAWERRRRQTLRKSDGDLTDEDLKELKGCIELGFGFNIDDGQRLCTTIPALDLYFAVNRQFLTSPLSSPAGGGSAPPLGNSAAIPTSGLSLHSCSFGRQSMSDSDSWKILSPGIQKFPRVDLFELSGLEALHVVLSEKACGFVAFMHVEATENDLLILD